MKINKFLKILIAGILLMLQFVFALKTVNAAEIGETKTLERGELGYYCVQKWNGSKWIYLTYNQTFYTDTDGQKYMAYCLCPGLPGVGYVSGEKETYDVKINQLLDNDVIWRVLKNGYPNKTVEQLGVETADDAYFATMQAVNAILRGYSLEQTKELYTPGQFAINGESYEDIQRRGNKTLNAMFNLIDIGLNGKETRDSFLQISIKQKGDLIKENKEVYSLQFQVQSSSEISDFKIDKLENLPKDSYITDLNGNAKEQFKGGEDFKLIIPAKNIKEDVKGKISIIAKQKNYPVYYGKSTVEGFQDFALCNNSFSNVNVSADFSFKTDKSKIILTKVDKDTGKVLKGVKFKVVLTDGSSKEYTTDEKGQIVINAQRPGNVVIQEVKALDKYSINKDKLNIELEFNETKEIKVDNQIQRGNIKVIKVDKDDNKIRLEGVEFELRDLNGKVIKNGKTDFNGELVFKNLVVGKYKLIETKTKEEYVLNNEEISIEVQNGKTIELVEQNEKIKVPEKPAKPEETPKEEVKEQPKQEIKELPKTGGKSFSSIQIATIISLFLVTSNLTLMIFYILFKHVKSRKNDK